MITFGSPNMKRGRIAQVYLFNENLIMYNQRFHDEGELQLHVSFSYYFANGGSLGDK